MRIGTWNLAGRWSLRHQTLLTEEECDVWLLTEVPPTFALPGGVLSRSDPMNEAGRSWAAVWITGAAVTVHSPHPAAALVERDGVLFCSSVLPWRGARPYWPDDGPDTAGITIAALGRLAPRLAASEHPVVWGGDWNHAMSGRETAGSLEGRRAIERLVAALGLCVTTAHAPHRISGGLSIDHIAVPAAWAREPCRRIVAEVEGARLSDHEAYVVDVVAP